VTFGEHTVLVEEVIDFAFSGRVLFAVGPPDETASAWITDHLRLALEANAGESEISRFQMAPQQNVSGWGNTDLLGHNMATGDDLRIEDVAEELSWRWHDLTENLVAGLAELCRASRQQYGLGVVVLRREPSVQRAH
jgi:hypothetical protein